MKRRWLGALNLVLPVIGIVLASAQTLRAADATDNAAFFSKSLQPFLEANCYSCHNPDRESGDLDLKAFTSVDDVLKHRDVFGDVLDRLEKGEMPPKKQPRPDADQQKLIITWLKAQFDSQNVSDKPNPGRVTARRLNRTEYNNTIRDLLGVDTHPGDDFPPDDSGYGFDNIADVLSMSPMLMEKYIKAAEKVARTAVFGPEILKSTSYTHQPWYIDFDTKNTMKADYDETGMSMPYAANAVHRFPVEGEYEITGWVRGFRPAGCDPIRLGFWIDGVMVHEGQIPVLHPEGELNGLSTSFKTKVTAGDHWLSVTILKIYEGLPPAYNGPNPSQTNARRSKQPTEFFAQNIRVVGPFSQKTGPLDECLNKIYDNGKIDRNDPDRAKKILANLAHRAYRRPVTDKEVADLLGLVKMVQDNGDSFDEGLCVAIQKILLSPSFLFRIESDPKDSAEAHAISPIELASRLSYFLWSTMPDDELLARAEDGSLSKPDVLESQVHRMLQDSKSHELTVNFGGQWLQYRALESHTVERKKFQQYTDYTIMSMQEETERFFDYIIHEDRPITDFVDANYSFLNQRLAEFYGIPGVKGHEFRKVELPPESHRSGVLTQASVLTVSSYATRTSPTIRGKWILENMLNAPPPPPPPNVPSLADDGIGKNVSMREQLSKHRENPTCASCHARMDPLGFGLENFDAIGAWRPKDGDYDIDSSGELPDGKSFKGPDELKQIILSQKHDFAECMADKMLTYALGRGLTRADKGTVSAIADQVDKNGYKFSSLVMGVVTSAPFEMRGGKADVSASAKAE